MGGVRSSGVFAFFQRRNHTKGWLGWNYLESGEGWQCMIDSTISPSLKPRNPILFLKLSILIMAGFDNA